MVSDSYFNHISLIKKAFSQQGGVELKQFLKKEKYEALKKQVLKLKFKKEELITSHSYSKANIKLDSEIIKYVENIIGKKLKNFEVWNFACKNYTTINDNYVEKEGIDIIFDLTENWNEEAGGAIHYIDGTGDFTKIKVESNKLTIFTREKNMHRFVKYVNSNAKNSKRIFIIGRTN